MKVSTKFILTVFVVGTILVCGRVAGAAVSDTLLVPWADTQGNFILDTLANAIAGDTLANGTRANMNRVYLLQRGGYYLNSKTITNHGFPLRIVGESPGSTFATAPPEIQINTSGGAPSHSIQIYDDVYFKNLWLSGCDESGVQGNYYQPIEIEGSNLHCYIDSCIMERSDFAVTAWTNSGNDVYFTNCKFRNLIEHNPTQQWTGRGISMWADEDTVVVENCTFFNVNMTAFQLEGGAARYFRFNHNTLVNVGRSIHSTSGSWWREAYVSNCLLVNQFWHGEGLCDYGTTFAPTRDPRAYTTGYFAVSPLPGKYGAPTGRRIGVSNIAAFLDPYFKTQYGDTIRAQGYTNAVTDSFFNTYSPANGGQMVIQDTNWISAYPGFTVNPDNATMTQAMFTFITKVRGYQYYGTGTRATPYDYALPVTAGDTDWTAVSWPLPENFTYTDQSLPNGKTLMTGSTDGLPLGDLNWFPTSLATFNSNKAQYVAAVEQIPGKKFFFNVDTLAEAEHGTAGGTTVVKSTPGLTYYDYTGAGSITWTFNVTTAGEYDTRWYVNECGRGTSGPVIAINGTQVHDKSHMWGQFVFDAATGVSGGMPNNAWIWVPITADSVGGTGTWSPGDSAAFTLATGTNTIAIIGGGWGEVKFAEIDLVVHGGTDTIKLKAPDAVVQLCTPGAEGVKWVASGFKFDSLSTAGTITWTLNVPAAGSYALNVAYQNSLANTTVQLKIDNGTPMNLSLPMNSDGVGHEALSDVVQLTQGSHTVLMSGAGANIDYIQLEQKVTGVKQRPGLPETFSLDQNYPNPFNPTTQINYSVPKRSLVTLTVYNVLGQKVATLFSGYQNAGNYQATFNAGRYASGVYFYRLEAGSHSMTKKMMLLK